MTVEKAITASVYLGRIEGAKKLGKDLPRFIKEGGYHLLDEDIYFLEEKIKETIECIIKEQKRNLKNL